ncbi:MAG: hypothetical protein J0I84_12955 [Terrimonas sp.]|uniref:hypothetical protein n=1 Tax=Terrimonas sp. TaxID=1914338 RepID=UPI000AF72C27|nr:hypothetical protein [Terrimonas sp.]MBN8787991.1 hypothetical protein [Terrimonas sp.]
MLNNLLYIDPGSGSYLVQVIAAAVLGVAFYFKTFVAWVKSFFGGKKNVSDKEEKINE